MTFALAASLSGIAGAATHHTSKGLIVSAAQNPTLGTILVSGKTVYTLKASKIRCGSQCLKIWPELLLPKGVQHATAGAGVKKAKLGSIKRGSRRQVTYGGKPLYWFSGDSGSGQVNGVLKDEWGTWSAVVIAKPAASPAPTVPAPTMPPATTTPTTAAASRTATTAPKSNPASTSPPATTPPATTPPPTVPRTTTPPTPTTPPPPPPTPTTSPGSGGVGF